MNEENISVSSEAPLKKSPEIQSIIVRVSSWHEKMPARSGKKSAGQADRRKRSGAQTYAPTDRRSGTGKSRDLQQQQLLLAFPPADRLSVSDERTQQTAENRQQQLEQLSGAAEPDNVVVL